MKALFFHDLKLAFGPGGGMLVSILFFVAVIILTPLGVGTDKQILIRIGPGMLWIGALFATLLSLDRLFQADRDDGSLDLLMMASLQRTLTLTIFVKCMAHWIGTIVPLVVIAPLLGLMLGLEPASLFAVTLTLLVGTPAITLIGAVGSALAVSLPRGGVLISIMVLPLVIPIMIFGVSAAEAATTPGISILPPLLFLVSLTLFFAVIGPLAAAAAFKHLSQ